MPALPLENLLEVLRHVSTEDLLSRRIISQRLGMIATKQIFRRYNMTYRQFGPGERFSHIQSAAHLRKCVKFFSFDMEPRGRVWMSGFSYHCSSLFFIIILSSDLDQIGWRRESSSCEARFFHAGHLQTESQQFNAITIWDKQP